MPHEWSLVVCGGGSGGHLFPALAVVEELLQRPDPPDRIVFLTADRAIDRQILEQHNVEQVAVTAVDSHLLRRRPLRAGRSLLKSVRESVQILKRLPAPVLLGTGGFGSVPGILAGRWRRRPIILLEQNIVPGRATSLLASFARVICVSFEETSRLLSASLPVEVTGNPVRQTISRLIEEAPSRKKRLLVLGGSQGATALNQAMLRVVAAHRELFSGWTIVHQTGAGEDVAVKEQYRQLKQRAQVSPFFENMEEQYRESQFVVTRAGGTSLAEVACAGLPAVVVPFPRSLRNHQLINARNFVGRNAAVLVEQGNAAGFDAELARALQLLITDKPHRREMRAAMQACAHPQAARQVADIVLRIQAGNSA